MELEFEPTEADLTALAFHQVRVSPVVHRRRVRIYIAYAVGLSMLTIGTALTTQGPVVPMVLAILAVGLVVAYPAVLQWRLEREVPFAVRQKTTRMSYAPRKIRALPDGLEQMTAHSHSKVAWTLVSGIHETPKHTFVSIDGAFTLVIPRERIPTMVYDSFMRAFRDYRTAAG
jgi:hypothetical protein